MISLGLTDWSIGLFWFFTGLFFVYIYQQLVQKPEARYLLRGYLIKSFSGVVFALVYLYYYHGGDTSEYFRSASSLNEILLEKPTLYFRLIFLDSQHATPLIHSAHKVIIYSQTDEEWFMVRLISPLLFLGFNSYLGITMIMSFLSFTGSFKLFQLMNKLIPGHLSLNFAVNFLIPTTLFWSSGLLKDTVTFACFAYLSYLFYVIFFERKLRWYYFPVIIFGSLIILQLKSYIIISFSVWILFALILLAFKSIHITALRYSIGTLIAALIFFAGYFSVSYIVAHNSEYNSENLFSKIRGFHSWHSQLGGSSYDLGEVEYTEVGLLKKAPAAINVTFFRPYFWEAQSPLVLLSSLESSAMFLLTLYTLWKTRLRFFRIVFGHPYIAGMLLFCLFFAFSIGITSYNFGALSRFKTPITALSTFILVYSIVRYREEYVSKASVGQLP